VPDNPRDDAHPLPRLRKRSYDAVVVGSGFGGSVAACRLAQAGFDVAVLERGRRFRPGEFPRVVGGHHGLLWDNGEGLYDIRPLNDMLIVQAAGLGGGSLVYANVQMRPPADLFAGGWPDGYSRPELDPYYDLVAHMLDVAPITPSPPSPKAPLKTHAMADALQSAGRRDQTFFPNLSISFRDPSQPPEPNRFGAIQSGCTYSGECIIGCNVGAKNSLDMNYLALAEREGAQIATHSEVTRVEPTSDGYRVHFRDPSHHGPVEHVDARWVFLCTGAINTTELLLRSRDQHRTLPGLSDRLGERYSGNGDFIAFAHDSTSRVEPTRGPTITTACVYDRVIDGRRTWFVAEDGGYAPQLARLLPFVHPERIGRHAEWSDEPGAGTDLERPLSERLVDDTDTAVMLVMGRDRADGHVELAGHDHHLRVRWNTAANLPLYAAEAAACGEIASALGGRLHFPATWRFFGQPVSTHHLGGCPMADDPMNGVVDPDGRVFGYPGLHVLDGAILPMAIGANPSHTIAAVAERCIERLIRSYTGDHSWRAPDAKDVTPRHVPESAVIIPATGTPKVPKVTGGIRYRERMNGVVPAPDGTRSDVPASRRFSFSITSSSVDVEHLVRDPAHPTTLSGHVRIEGMTPRDGEPVAGGSFHLLVDEGDPRVRVMLYVLPFRTSADGRTWTLRGRKEVGGAGPFELWRSLTTMEATLEPADGEHVTGWAKIDTGDAVRLLLSIRAVGGDGRWGAVRGLWTFERFFVSSVLKVFLAGLRARAARITHAP
jgi:cholesterol oxidase